MYTFYWDGMNKKLVWGWENTEKLSERSVNEGAAKQGKMCGKDGKMKNRQGIDPANWSSTSLRNEVAILKMPV